MSEKHINSAIRITGPDTVTFLQGQLTCDVSALEDGSLAYGAHCDPKGRVLSLFQVLRQNDVYFLITQSDMVNLTKAGLAKYAVFSKVSLEATDAPPDANATILNKHSDQIKAGIPKLHPETSGKFLPHELNLDNVNAINLEKGCYTGQEVIARIHYRGKTKNHLHGAILTTEETILPGDDVYASDKAIGKVVDCCELDSGYHALILLPDQHATNANLYCESDKDSFFTLS